jgi:hypothetical protein
MTHLKAFGHSNRRRNDTFNKEIAISSIPRKIGLARFSG